MRASRRNWREPFRVFGQVIGGAFCVPIENNTLGFRKTRERERERERGKYKVLHFLSSKIEEIPRDHQESLNESLNF